MSSVLLLWILAQTVGKVRFFSWNRKLDEVSRGRRQPVTHELSEVVITTIEFMVSQDKGIETELIDGLSNLFTTIVLEV